jgi:hypothetical protein
MLYLRLLAEVNGPLFIARFWTDHTLDLFVNDNVKRKYTCEIFLCRNKGLAKKNHPKIGFRFHDWYSS